MYAAVNLDIRMMVNSETSEYLLSIHIYKLLGMKLNQTKILLEWSADKLFMPYNNVWSVGNISSCGYPGTYFRFTHF